MLARVQRAIFFVLWHDDVKAPWLKLNAAARAESKTEAEQEQPPETRARASTKWRVPSSPSPPRHVFRSRSLYPLHSFPPILTLSLSLSLPLPLSLVRFREKSSLKTCQAYLNLANYRLGLSKYNQQQAFLRAKIRQKYGIKLSRATLCLRGK